MWDFDHPPLASTLAARYQVHSTQPAQCAVELLEGRADLGLIPIASLTPSLAIVSGCAIASLDRVRSIQLIIKLNNSPADDIDRVLARVRTIAADTASRSSLAYAQILFRKFIGTAPQFLPAPLIAQESRTQIEAAVGPCLWLDLAHEWHARTKLPWVAAVWAVRPESLAASSITPAQLTADLQLSRDHGLANIDQLVAEWTPRIAIPPETIRHYLTRNIHYTLSPDCVAAIQLFRSHAAEASLLPPLPTLRFL
jgi:chorismate dehydratase